MSSIFLLGLFYLCVCVKGVSCRPPFLVGDHVYKIRALKFLSDHSQICIFSPCLFPMPVELSQVLCMLRNFQLCWGHFGYHLASLALVESLQSMLIFLFWQHSTWLGSNHTFWPDFFGLASKVNMVFKSVVRVLHVASLGLEGRGPYPVTYFSPSVCAVQTQIIAHAAQGSQEFIHNWREQVFSSSSLSAISPVLSFHSPFSVLWP